MVAMASREVAAAAGPPDGHKRWQPKLYYYFVKSTQRLKGHGAFTAADGRFYKRITDTSLPRPLRSEETAQHFCCWLSRRSRLALRRVTLGLQE